MFFKEKEKVNATQASKTEAERAQRINAIIKVEYGNDKRKCIDFTKNVSRVGLFISTARPFEKGETIELKFFVPNGNYPIRVKGAVVWSRSEPEGVSKVRGMGVKFLNLAPWDEEAITDFVQSNRR
jgi:uncharacterized protein (TIGR02266 family)